LASVLRAAFEAHFKQSKDETILVVTDGQPDSERDVKDAIIKATHRLTRPEELSVSQVIFFIVLLPFFPKILQFLSSFRAHFVSSSSFILAIISFYHFVLSFRSIISFHHFVPSFRSIISFHHFVPSFRSIISFLHLVLSAFDKNDRYHSFK
jgi:hypothetical protein